MTQAEVQTLIEQELKRALGGHGIQINLRENSQRVARESGEAAERQREKDEKRQRKESKRLRESTRQTFEMSGMTREQAKKASKAVTSPAYQARLRG